ncbi:hypothetical protein [Pantoea piersonii]|uniref:hypothetical protein n=1 Tax=Pantoea piersonii TaxID=2364647 RepID=UPI0022F1D03F|nr:hypothetical protein [Pantoea piersonii]WBV23039.1 hypothetical protein PG877_07800 [Pantoea piersonii]
MKKMKITLLALSLGFSFTSSAADWAVTYNNDEMRGTAQKFLQTQSDNDVEFDFPYNGGSKMAIILRSKKTELKEGQKAEDLKPTEAILAISKGQFSCHSFNDCHVSVKFDNDKIQKYSMSESGNGNSDVIFFDQSSSFIKNIQSHKKVIIEAEFFQAGAKQFKFDLEGFANPKSN